MRTINRQKLVSLFLIPWIAAILFTPIVYAKDQTNIIPVGVLANWPPQYITDSESGKPAGFAIDIFDNLARRAGFEVEYKVYNSWGEINRAFSQSDVLVIPNSGITAEREGLYQFTAPIEAFQIHTFVRSTSGDISGWIKDQPLAPDTQIGVVKDNKGLFLMREKGYERLHIYDNLNDAFLGLLSAEVDALVYPEPPVMRLAYQSGLEHLIQTVGDPLFEVKRAVAVRKGNPELYEKLNRAVTDLTKSDQYWRIYQKWYGKPVSFWNARLVILLMIGLVIVTATLLSLWHYRSLSRINKELRKQIDVRRASEQELQKAHESLERKVEERTLQIKSTNEQLRAEISERVKAEKQIKASLKEKETLLQEVHHRVKNNMQVVASLLALQANNVSDPQVMEALQESQGRVYAMSAVHETLYRSKNLAEIEIESYLAKIADAISQTHPSSGAVQMTFELDDITLTIEKASPVGLIMNELISNAYKYAFPDGKKGRLTIRFRKTSEAEAELTVSDNGIGMPPDIDWRNSKTLGLQLVRTLTENQLDGSLDITSNQGTTITVKFPLAES